jgi:hypothetical protein
VRRLHRPQIAATPSLGSISAKVSIEMRAGLLVAASGPHDRKRHTGLTHPAADAILLRSATSDFNA